MGDMHLVETPLGYFTMTKDDLLFDSGENPAIADEDFDRWLIESLMPEAETLQKPKCNTPKDVEIQEPLFIPFAYYDANQVAVLESEFAKCQHPHDSTIRELSSRLLLPTDLVKAWFDVRYFEQPRAFTTSFENFGQSSPEPFEFGCYSPSADSGGPQRRARRNFKQSEIDILEDAFEKNQFPDCATYDTLVSRLGLAYERIRNWFKNRRQRQKWQKNNERPQTALTPCNNFNNSVAPITFEFATPTTSSSVAQTFCVFEKHSSNKYVPQSSYKFEQKTSYDYVSRTSCEFEQKTSYEYIRQSSCKFEQKTSYDYISRTSYEFEQKTSSDFEPPVWSVLQTSPAVQFELTEGKREVLEREYQQCSKPDYAKVDSLAWSMKLNYNTVRSWFKNRRVQEKALEGQGDFEQYQMDSYGNAAFSSNPQYSGDASSHLYRSTYSIC